MSTVTYDPTLELLSWGYADQPLTMAPQRWQPVVASIRGHNVFNSITVPTVQEMLDAIFGAGVVVAANVVLAKAPPDPTFAAVQGPPSTLNLTSSMADSGLPDRLIRWDFGDGATGVGARITHKFPKPGNYPIRSIVTVVGVASSSAATTRVT